MEIKILDHGYLKLVLTYGSDQAVIEDARMSTDKGFLGWGRPCPNHPHDKECICKGTEYITGDEKLLRYLYTHRHMTPFEGSGLKFEIKAPIMVFREWHRHRTQSYNEMSGRYVEIPNEHYVPSIERLINAAVEATITENKQMKSITTSEDIHKFNREWAEGTRLLMAAAQQRQQEDYELFLRSGVPKELARINMPLSRYSRMRATANLRNWLAFLTLREDPAAQWEIRQYAHAISEVIKEYFPRTHKLYVENK